MFLIFVSSLAMFGWGLYKGPIFNWEAYCREPFDGYPPRPGLFFITAAATSFGTAGAFISGLFLFGVLPRGQ
jgi:hypothetical protein